MCTTAKMLTLACLLQQTCNIKLLTHREKKSHFSSWNVFTAQRVFSISMKSDQELTQWLDWEKKASHLLWGTVIAMKLTELEEMM